MAGGGRGQSPAVSRNLTIVSHLHIRHGPRLDAGTSGKASQAPNCPFLWPPSILVTPVHHNLVHPSKCQLYSSTQSWVVRAEKVCVAGFSHSLHPPDAPLTSSSTIQPSELSHLQNLEPVTCTCTKFTSIHLLLSLAPNSCSCSSLNYGSYPHLHCWQLKHQSSSICGYSLDWDRPKLG